MFLKICIFFNFKLKKYFKNTSFSYGVFGNVVKVTFQSVFHSEKYINNIFFIF